MSKVTSKLQVTVPKAIADRVGIRPGDELTWEPVGGTLLVIPRRPSGLVLSTLARLALFDAATARQDDRNRRAEMTEPPEDRGWTREELYDRAGAR
ncbi:MAG: AbrB/MazE/SpoVT family DNA-binding domain-containing protein [Thermoanaerobaculaceae bacterium]